jgi:hypothetical protein
MSRVVRYVCKCLWEFAVLLDAALSFGSEDKRKGDGREQHDISRHIGCRHQHGDMIDFTQRGPKMFHSTSLLY